MAKSNQSKQDIKEFKFDPELINREYAKLFNPTIDDTIAKLEMLKKDLNSEAFKKEGYKNATFAIAGFVEKCLYLKQIGIFKHQLIRQSSEEGLGPDYDKDMANKTDHYNIENVCWYKDPDIDIKKEAYDILFFCSLSGYSEIVRFMLTIDQNKYWTASVQDSLIQNTFAKQDPKMLEVLLDCEIDVNAQWLVNSCISNDNIWQLSYLIENNLSNFELVKILLDRGMDANSYAKDDFSNEPILSYFLLYPKIVSLFLDKGADPKLTNSKGKSVFEIADELKLEQEKEIKSLDDQSDEKKWRLEALDRCNKTIELLSQTIAVKPATKRNVEEVQDINDKKKDDEEKEKGDTDIEGINQAMEALEISSPTLQDTANNDVELGGVDENAESAI